MRPGPSPQITGFVAETNESARARVRARATAINKRRRAICNVAFGSACSSCSVF
jgi:hypothetical protein